MRQRSRDIQTRTAPAAPGPKRAAAREAAAVALASPLAPLEPATVTSIQQLAGNRAATELIAQREPTTTTPPGPTTTPPASDTEAPAKDAGYYRAVTSSNWAQAAKELDGMSDEEIATKVALLNHDQLLEIDTAAHMAKPSALARVTAAIAKFDAEADRVGTLSANYETALAASDWPNAIIHLNGFNDTDIIAKLHKLNPAQLGHMKEAAKTTTVGGGRMARYVDAVAGVEIHTRTDEQVGGRVFTVQGGYTCTLTPTAVRVSVGMNFKPDNGVVVPTDTWFGYIRGKWNHFSAVNQDNPAEKFAIEFVPVAGEGHDIQVSSGDGRANAGHYYTGGSNAANVISHEFGHLIGLEDEYERDAADYQRVTGEAPAAGSGDTATAGTIAAGIHDALFSSESFFERHRTAERRRMQLVNKVLADNHIAANYQMSRSALTREVSIQYAARYGHEMSQDFMSQVDTQEDEFNTWREQTLGSFQVTSGSLMGDMSDHDHPVEARHVRKFSRGIQDTLGRGTWQPVEDH